MGSKSEMTPEIIDKMIEDIPEIIAALRRDLEYQGILKEEKCFLGISSSGWLQLFTAGSVGIIFMVRNGKRR